MNCLWLILILAFCGGNTFGIGNGRSNNCNNGCDDDYGYGRSRDDDYGYDRNRDDDCGCGNGSGRRVTSMPVFDRRDNDTCGCECQED